MFDCDLPPLLTEPELESLTAAEFAAWDEAESDRQLIPADLDEWTPGPHLSAVLSSIDPSRLNGYDAVIVMRAQARQVSHDQAGYYRSIREVATAVPTDEYGPPLRSEQWFEYTNLELRAALTLTRRAADGPPPARNVKSTPNTPPVSSWDVACRQPNATSTIAHPGQRAEKPVSKTMHPSADTTTSAVTEQDGPT